jgi:uncharacterized protein (TIGR02284 family)
MATQTEEFVSTLNELIETCQDGAEGYKKAAEDVEENSLRTLFAEYSSQRAQFAAELRTAVAAQGGKATESGHTAGSLHRAWMSIKESFGNKDKVIIDECEAGEDRALKAYRNAFDHNFDGPIGELVSRQFAAVQTAHDKLRTLKHGRK